MQKRSIVLIFIAAIMLITGIYFFSVKHPGPGAGENVTICYATLYSGLIPIAESQDFFLQEGLNVTLKRSPTGKAALESMFNGECSISTTAETPIVFHSFNRKDFSIFATIGTSNNFSKIIARGDRGIREPGDLKGKRIATQKGTFSHYFIHVFHLKNGINENDVTILFNNAEKLPQMLYSGEIDAFSMGEPHISNAKNLMGENYILFADPQLSIVTVNILAMNSYIKDRPQVINKTLLALIKAEEYVKSHPEETIKNLSGHYGVEESEISILLANNNMGISLDQYLLIILENEARWALNTNQTGAANIPNFLDIIQTDNLERIEPQAVTIIR